MRFWCFPCKTETYVTHSQSQLLILSRMSPHTRVQGPHRKCDTKEYIDRVCYVIICFKYLEPTPTLGKPGPSHQAKAS